MHDLVKMGIRDDNGTVETPWVEPLGDDRYRLANIPFFAYRISEDDIVEAIPDAGGQLMFVRVIKKSGNRTIRVILAEDVDNEIRDMFFADMRRFGCTMEGAFKTLICFTVPAATSLETVAEDLTARGFQWEYADPKYEDLFPDG